MIILCNFSYKVVAEFMSNLTWCSLSMYHYWRKGCIYWGKEHCLCCSYW